ncbi:hypothetical protein DKP68_24570, partial [Salmonella enterica subsp. enterica serovar Johannesburg]|nr:hypothetical protein [Salmonella enterica subsp. enterica serovar Johannesburg]
KESRDALREDIANANDKLSKLQSKSDKVMQDSGNVKAALSQEVAKTRALKEEIARLEDEHD